MAAAVVASLPVPFRDRNPFAVALTAGLAIPFAVVEAFLPRVAGVGRVGGRVPHILHAVESTPMVIDCVWVVAELPLMLER